MKFLRLNFLALNLLLYANGGDSSNFREDKSLRYVEWFEAAGPEASCDIPDSVLTQFGVTDYDDEDEEIGRQQRDGSREDEGEMNRGSPEFLKELEKIDFKLKKFRERRKVSHGKVCRGAENGEVKCICVRSPFSKREYHLECGKCRDPCALEFIPDNVVYYKADEHAFSIVDAGRRSENVRNEVEKPRKKSSSPSEGDMSEDLKKMLLKGFFNQILRSPKKILH